MSATAAARNQCEYCHEQPGKPRFCSQSCASKQRWNSTPHDLETKFWSKVDKKPGQGPKGDCWEWTGSRRPGEYGQIALKVNGKYTTRTASRVAYELTFGPLPKDLFACHRCDNPPCCRPDHLFAGTNLDNIRDAQAKGRFKIAAADSRLKTRFFILTSEQLAYLKRARRDKGVSIYDAAALLLIHYSAYSRKENGLVRFAEIELQKLCDELGINITNFSKGEKETVKVVPNRSKYNPVNSRLSVAA